MNSQSIAKRLYEFGCYFLSLLHIAGRDNDAIGLYRQSVQLGAMREDCYILDPGKVLSLAVGGSWNVRHESAGYLPTSDEWEILRYERKTTSTTYAHFVVGDGRGQVAYDPLDKSQTVALGELVSKRIVKRLA